MFRYKIGTVRLFGSKENLTLAHDSLAGAHDSVLTEEYLQFVVPKTDIPSFVSMMGELITEKQYSHCIMWEGVQYGAPCEKKIYDTYCDTSYRDIEKYGFVKEYFNYRDSEEYAQEKLNKNIRKVENVLTKLKEKVKVNV